MSTNNFKQLEEDAINQHPHAPIRVEKNLNGNIKVFDMAGQVIELYMPRLFDLLIILLGGEPEGRARDNKSNL